MADSRLVFKIIIVGVLALISFQTAQGAPATDLQAETLAKNCTNDDNPQQNDEEFDVIDQRQNGTENYRINVKDVVLIWAPAEALFAATALLDTQILGQELLGGDIYSDLEKPEVPQVEVESKPLPQNSSAPEPSANENDHGPINPTSKPAHLRSILR